MLRLKPNLIGYLCAAACALPVYGQYPGHINPEQQESAGHLRATAVLEYTGDLKDPKANRLIPIAVWDGTQYQPGGLYLAEPAPLAVLSGTQYELEVAGQPKGFFDIRDAENIAGLWVGVGTYQAPPVVVRRPKSQHMPQEVKDYNPDKPHFAHRPADENSAGGGSQESTTAKNAPLADPDRPTLHERPGGASSGSGSSPDSGAGSASNPAPDVDPDRPTLHTHHNSNSTAATSAQPAVDPDRPRLGYGKPAEQEKIDKADALFGVPTDMQQIAGVSDARSTEHESYAYSWANPDDENKMKADLETIAAQAVAPPPPVAQSTATTAHTGTHARRHKAALPTAPKLPELTDESFHAFGLSFGGGATMVLSGRTVDTPTKYVTIVAQPDFYGKPQVLLKQVTSDNRLDVTPRLQLIDAVDTEGSGRADLLFELRGLTFRQFAIYRIAGGLATQAFVTQPSPTQASAY